MSVLAAILLTSSEEGGSAAVTFAAVISDCDSVGVALLVDVGRFAASAALSDADGADAVSSMSPRTSPRAIFLRNGFSTEKWSTAPNFEPIVSLLLASAPLSTAVESAAVGGRRRYRRYATYKMKARAASAPREASEFFVVSNSFLLFSSAAIATESRSPPEDGAIDEDDELDDDALDEADALRDTERVSVRRGPVGSDDAVDVRVARADAVEDEIALTVRVERALAVPARDGADVPDNDAVLVVDGVAVFEGVGDTLRLAPCDREDVGLLVPEGVPVCVTVRVGVTEDVDDAVTDGV